MSESVSGSHEAEVVQATALPPKDRKVLWISVAVSLFLLLAVVFILIALSEREQDRFCCSDYPHCTATYPEGWPSTSICDPAIRVNPREYPVDSMTTFDCLGGSWDSLYNWKETTSLGVAIPICSPEGSTDGGYTSAIYFNLATGSGILTYYQLQKPGNLIFTGSGPIFLDYWTSQAISGNCTDLPVPSGGVYGTDTVTLRITSTFPSSIQVRIRSAPHTRATLVYWPDLESTSPATLIPAEFEAFADALCQVCDPVQYDGTCLATTKYGFNSICDETGEYEEEAALDGYEEYTRCSSTWDWTLGRPYSFGSAALLPELTNKCANDPQQDASESAVASDCDGGKFNRSKLDRGSDQERETQPEQLGREAKAELWLQKARGEHASIASFSRFSLQLLTLGAPAKLVELAHEAALDELRHAEASLVLARHFGADPALDFGTYPAHTLSISHDLTEMLLLTLKEGAAETESVLQMARELSQLSAVEAAAVGRIIADEARHSALAWLTLRWGLSKDATLAAAYRRELDFKKSTSTELFKQLQAWLLADTPLTQSWAAGSAEQLIIDAITALEPALNLRKAQLHFGTETI